MASLHYRHIPFYCFLILVLSSNQRPLLNPTKNQSLTNLGRERHYPNRFWNQSWKGKQQMLSKPLLNFLKRTEYQIVTKITLQNATRSGTAIYHRINSLLTRNSDAYTKRCLTACYTQYNNAIDVIKKSLAALDSRNYGNVNVWVKAAIDYSSTCEDGFQQMLHRKPPMNSLIVNFDRLCSSGLKLLNLLVEKERLLDEGCAQTSDKEVCKFIVEARLENKTIALQGLAKRAVENALKDGVQILCHINVLLNTTADQKIQKRRLELCSNFYQNAIDSMRDSLPALDAKHYRDTSTLIGATFDETET